MTPPEIPVTPAGQIALSLIGSAPSRSLLAFDFDGTLAGIVEDPALARAYPGAVDALAELGRKGARIVIVTGRPAELVLQYGGFRGVPGLEGLVVLGHYGAERWDAGSDRVVAAPPPAGLDDVRLALPELLDGTDAHVEEKGRSVAVHTRRARDPQGLLDELRAPLTTLATRHDLIVEPGRMVLEIRPPGVDKGAALTVLLEETRPKAVLYAGDDLGDLPAFTAIEKLRAERGLAGVLVCSGSSEVAALAERADVVVDGPAGVVELLRGLN